VSVADATTGGSDTCVAAYEELRRHVLTGAIIGSHFGVVLLLREGITAWMARASGYSARSAPAADGDWRAPTPILSHDIHAGIVRVLASMAMAGRGESRV